ncbi:MAG TPA: cation:proton antiporter [Conexibacter sp.]|nr:cation:proton antiporter [Conexibacter sp.]
MDFGTLVVIVLAGFGGPLLSVVGQRFVPVVIGEILAGIVVGPALLGVVDPAEPTVAFLAQVGFAMLMLTVGMHLPLRDRRLLPSLHGGMLLAAIVGLLAIPAGLLAAVAGGGDAAIYAVLLASGSAAVLLPALEEADVESSDAMTVMAQVTVADVVTILSVPIVLQPDRIGDAGLASALIVGCVLVLLAAARLLARRPWARRLRRLSKRRRWALDLRLSLLVLFFLAWIAQESGTSVLLAGFAAGVLVAILGGPKRLSTQTRGVADGFFIPLFFVVLGAGLDVGGLLHEPSLLSLVAILAVLTVAIRLLAARLLHIRPAAALAASAQLGVPAAIASLGLAEQVLSAATATAIVAAALVSLAVSTVGVERLAGSRAS